ncbi:MAG: CDP-glycerol glycerophosphotransferase family protein [Sulfurovum sp.]|nr:CDP-glycerol glycerophosphotransferase family protein [Sulfurovum sp.]
MSSNTQIVQKSKIEILREALENDYTNLDIWYDLVKEYEEKEEYENAILCYEAIIDRKEDFDGSLYFKLGHTFALQEKHEEASLAFKEQRIMQDAHGVIEAPYRKDKRLHNIINYTEYYERCTLEENTIVYESYHGSSMSCSPYAIFKSLLVDDRFDEYKHIWVINDIDKASPKYKEYKNIIFVKKSTTLYMRYLATAKYLINNTTFPDWYIRKEGQVYLNTWHGTPLKTLGRDVKEDFFAHKNQTKNFLQASHIISPNQHTTKILENSYDIKDIYTGILATTGYPRQDLMLNITDNEKSNIYKSLDINESNTIVLYAPTWRGTVNGAEFNTEQLSNDIEYLSTLNNVTILFRGHYMVEKLLSEAQVNVTVVPNKLDTNSVLSIVDILITDYSSICFDFMVMQKPIVYYVYDREIYEKERGLYFKLEDIGDYICYDISKVKEFLEDIIKDKKITKLQRKVKKNFCKYDDGNATQRIIDMIFLNKTNDIHIEKKLKKESILIYGGPLMANGITTSFINLANYIDKTKYSVTITFDPNAILLEDIRMNQFNKFDNDIKVVPRFGSMLMTLEERNVLARFNSSKGLPGEEMWSLYEYAHKREFKRVFGHGKFDYIVNFEGYTVFWSVLMGMKLDGVKSNAIYQHNDLYSEHTMKYPYLAQTFDLYRFYDNVVSVSEKTKEHNKDNLSMRFNIPKEKFIYCDNVQDPNNILEKSKETIDIESHRKIFKNKKVFINIGRLSPEKGHIKMIHAFAKVHEQYPETCLINLGHGVLESEIKSLIKKLKLEKNVFYLGQVSNPYKYLKASDCFVLPSDHEGQPMTLLEALILEKPVIATDIVGNRSVLEGRPGHLVENSEEGIIDGMIHFLKGDYKDDKVFDYKKYNQDALDMFYQKVLDIKSEI